MEQQHRTLINDNLPDLIKSTENIELVATVLLERNVINKWMEEHIKEPHEKLSKNKRLYNVIQGRGPRAFMHLCRTLQDTKNIRARNILTASKTNVEISFTNLLNISRNNTNASSSNDNDLKHEPYVKIHPERRRMDVHHENLPTGAYPMGSNPKGHALILNMNKIIGKDERIGSEVDVRNLLLLFEGLGYVVQANIDLTKIEFQNIIEAFVEKCQNEKTDSIIVFIMSHGEGGSDPARSSDILTADGKNINTDWIIEQFGPDKISKNIPKLFFIQACRGTMSDLGYRTFGTENNRLQHDCTSNDDSATGTIVNRRYENVFIAYATIPGYNAKRHPIDGSWFVQKLCDVIRERAWEYDLDLLMKLVDSEIKKLNCTLNGFQTVEWTYRGFNKKFYFNPGLYDDNAVDGTSNNN